MFPQTISTPKANYVLVFTDNHGTTITPPDVAFDAVVIETGYNTHKEASKQAPNSVDYFKILKKASQQKAQVWFTDASPIDTDSKATSKNRAKLITMTLGLLPTLKAGIDLEKVRTGKMPRRDFLRFGAFAGLSLAATGLGLKLGILQTKDRYAVEARNALTAEKLEEFVAPKIQSEIKRKPTIVVVWGSAHKNIGSMLSNSTLRRNALKEIDFDKVLLRTYRNATRFRLDQKGKVINYEEFNEALKLRNSQASKVSTRRDFLKQFRRRA